MITLLLIYFIFPAFVNGANIFAHFIAPSLSHQVVFQTIWRELSLRGHKVTVITPNPLNDPSLINLTEIDVGFSYESLNISDFLDDRSFPHNFWKFFNLRVNPEIFRNQLENPHFKRFLSKEDNFDFDLVLVEMYWSPAHVFAHKFNCPFIGLLSFTGTQTVNFPVGNPIHPVAFPDILLGYGNEMNIFQRLVSVYTSLMMIISYDYEILPKLDQLARTYFGDDIPYLGDIEKNVSLILATHNFIASKPKPTVPALIEIGNVHLKKNMKLPQDLQTEFDKETNGIIYMSLGSNVKSANISSTLRSVFISTFADLPYKVLWKWETDYLPGKPDNVITRKWLPQEAVLAHPNVKVFVTQGGLQSLEEAIYYRTPMVGIPFFGDQMKNVKSLDEHGIGIGLNMETITKELLKSAILEVMNDKKYKEKISELADIIWDQPMSGLDTAIWWIEYVIRHKGAKHLRSPLLDMPLYQYLLLDVIAFVLGLLIITLSVLYAVYHFIRYSLFKQKKTKTA